MQVDTSDYDAGLLNDYGGGNVDWWWDYLRAEIGRANEHWRVQHEGHLAAAVQAEREACARIGEHHDDMANRGFVTCLQDTIDAIRARGPTPALDAALAQARRETWEKAVEICAAVSGKEHRAALNYPAREEGGDGSREDSLNAALAAMDCAAAIRSAAAGEEGK